MSLSGHPQKAHHSEDTYAFREAAKHTVHGYERPTTGGLDRKMWHFLAAQTARVLYAGSPLRSTTTVSFKGFLDIEISCRGLYN